MVKKAISRRLVNASIIAFAIILVIALPVLAYLSNPTSMSIVSMRWFRNVATDGDMIGIFHYNIAFGTYPTTPASSTILFRLYDTDYTTLLATTAPYVYSLFETYGYGNGVGGLYFPPTAGLTWGSAYRIEIYGLPAYFSGLSPVTTDMTAVNWNSANVTQADQRAEMYAYVLQLCDTFKTIYTTIPLKTITDGTVSLSIYGESYFTGAIPGIYDMCPGLFFSQIYVPEVMPTDNYTMAMADFYKTKMQHTDLERGLNRTGALIGVSGQFLAGVITIALCIGACVLSMRKGWGIESGYVISGGIVLTACTVVGGVIFTIVMAIAFAGIIAIVQIVWLKRAA